jgi:hypothetical protein
MAKGCREIGTLGSRLRISGAQNGSLRDRRHIPWTWNVDQFDFERVAFVTTGRGQAKLRDIADAGTTGLLSGNTA